MQQPRQIPRAGKVVAAEARRFHEDLGLSDCAKGALQTGVSNIK